MKVVAMAEAKANLSALVEEVEAGETVCITRHGKAVAHLTAAKAKKPLDVDALRRLTASMPMQDEDGGDFMRRLRDDARY